MAETETQVDPDEAARRRFNELSAEHEMAVLHDDGLYRHLRFSRPETGVYSFDIVTWPGYLSLTGDLTSGLTFCRIEDMLEFFAGDRINPGYWSEKLVNYDVMNATKVYGEFDSIDGEAPWEWAPQFLVCCHAIQWAANNYLAVTRPEATDA